MNELVLLTGGSGFVGSAIARALLAAGYRVRALVRPSSPRNNLAGLDLEMVDGDICDTAAMRRAMRGAQRVVHAAADYRLWTRDPAALVRANVGGTRTVMDAALAEGVPRVVYTSSVATLRPRNDGAASEADTENEAGAIGAYKRSKVAA